eukprot:1034692-Pleurochrysis_carterae.AAC.1
MPPVNNEKPLQCVCGSTFSSEKGLSIHMARFCSKVNQASSETFTSASAASEAAQRSSAEEFRDSQDARSFVYADEVRYKVAMDLAQLRYVKLVPAAHVDIIKGYVSNWLISAADAIISDVNAELSGLKLGRLGAEVAESIGEGVRRKLDFFDGLRTEYQES